jgi:putative hemolysin
MNKLGGFMLSLIQSLPVPNHFRSFQRKVVSLLLRSFEPKLRFDIDAQKYRIKTAETIEELNQVLRLRYEVFIKEGLNQRKMIGVDFDRYDLLGDHVLLIEKSSNKVIGTYRIMCSLFTDEFYSENEFHLEDFIKQPGIKMELGRACIHKDYRTGSAIHLVWKGLGAYARLSNADYLFGCASVHTEDCGKSKGLYEYLKNDNYSDKFNISPQDEFLFHHWNEVTPMISTEEAEELLPSLMKSYFKAGAKTHSIPAYDKKFKCIDFITILEIKKMNPKYEKKYLSDKS